MQKYVEKVKHKAVRRLQYLTIHVGCNIWALRPKVGTTTVL